VSFAQVICPHLQRPRVEQAVSQTQEGGVQMLSAYECQRVISSRMHSVILAQEVVL
jgi:polysaccharide pyruvyl transferase WcaK-like protein